MSVKQSNIVHLNAPKDISPRPMSDTDHLAARADGQTNYIATCKSHLLLRWIIANSEISVSAQRAK